MTTEILTAKGMQTRKTPNGEKDGDAAEIITAVGGALGGVASVIDSVSNAANPGQAGTTKTTTQENYTPTTTDKKTNPWLIGGLVGGGLLILLLLVFMNKPAKSNGRSTKQ